MTNLFLLDHPVLDLVFVCVVAATTVACPVIEIAIVIAIVIVVVIVVVSVTVGTLPLSFDYWFAASLLHIHNKRISKSSA